MFTKFEMPADKITDPQHDFIRDLLASREISSVIRIAIEDALMAGKLTKAGASRIIEKLVALPVIPGTTRRLPSKDEAIAYGRKTGKCAICHRELTNPESIERGIGPICAEKMGW